MPQTADATAPRVLGLVAGQAEHGVHLVGAYAGHLGHLVRRLEQPHQLLGVRPLLLVPAPAADDEDAGRADDHEVRTRTLDLGPGVDDLPVIEGKIGQRALDHDIDFCRCELCHGPLLCCQSDGTATRSRLAGERFNVAPMPNFRVQGARQAWSDDHHGQARVHPPQVVRIGRDDLVTLQLRFDNHVYVYDVGVARAAAEPHRSLGPWAGP